MVLKNVVLLTLLFLHGNLQLFSHKILLYFSPQGFVPEETFLTTKFFPITPEVDGTVIILKGVT